MSIQLGMHFSCSTSLRWPYFIILWPWLWSSFASMPLKLFLQTLQQTLQLAFFNVSSSQKLTLPSHYPWDACNWPLDDLNIINHSIRPKQTTLLPSDEDQAVTEPVDNLFLTLDLCFLQTCITHEAYQNQWFLFNSYLPRANHPLKPSDFITPPATQPLK